MKYEVTLTPKDKQMIDDDNYFDVTEHEVKMLLRRMACTHMPRQDIIRMRIKYDKWINDAEKKFLTSLGVSYDTHTITVVGRPRRFYVDGYTASQWKMLHDANYVPTISNLMTFLNHCENTKDFSAIEILSSKYQGMLDEREKNILEKNNIPPGTAFSSLTYLRINGLRFYWWKLLNEDNISPPPRHHLLSIINTLRDSEYAEEAEALEQKFLTYLYPEMAKPEMQKEIAEARAFFRNRYPYDD